MAANPVKAIYKGKKPKKILQPRAARHLGHPHELSNGADMHRHPMPDVGKTRTPKESKITRHHGDMVDRNVEVLVQAVPELGRTEDEIYADKMSALEQTEQGQAMTPAKRSAYAALETHKEMASVKLSAGSTMEEAADYAGVSVTTIRRYFEDEHFRTRVEEQKAIVKGMVGGRILSSLDRLTEDPEKLDNLAVRDRLALYDRFEPGSGSHQPSVTQQNNTLIVGDYSELMDRLGQVARQSPAQAAKPVADAGAEGGDFPVVGADRSAVAGGGS